MVGEKDEKYGHLIGDFKCLVPDCQGHRKVFHATMHKIVVDHGLDRKITKRKVKKSKQQGETQKRKTRRKKK